MFKKALSLIIAVMMMASVAVVGASAAETETEATADANKIYFQVPDDWSNYKAIYCHIWAIDGTGSWPVWQSKAEKCKDEGNKLFSYDLSKTKNEIDPAKGVGYAVIFSASTGIQTYNALMSAECIGDTLYCTGNLLENPEDDAKKAIEATWKNHTDKYGPEKKITSSGSVVGTALPEGSTDATLLATYIVQYLGDTTKTDKIPNLMKQLNVTPEETYAEAAKRLDDNGDEKADEKKAEIKTLLGVKDTPAPTPSNGDNKNNNSNTTTNNNNNSTSGSTTNNGTATGESDTALFIMAGLMVLAAGVMFAARKREN